MNLQRLLYGKYSKVILSIILGFGLATFLEKLVTVGNVITL